MLLATSIVYIARVVRFQEKIAFLIYFQNILFAKEKVILKYSAIQSALLNQLFDVIYV